MHQRGSKLSKLTKAEIGIANESGSVLIAIDRSRGNNRKRVICRGHTSRLNFSTQDVVYEGRFARLLGRSRDNIEKRCKFGGSGAVGGLACFHLHLDIVRVNVPSDCQPKIQREEKFPDLTVELVVLVAREREIKEVKKSA